MVLSNGNILAYGVTMSHETYDRIHSFDFLNKVLTRLGLVSRPIANVNWTLGLYKYVDSAK